MKKIETLEQRNKALEWMVETANEIENHPLITEEEKAKKLAVYDYVSQQVQGYNEKLFKEYPPDHPQDEPKEEVDLSGWLDE